MGKAAERNEINLFKVSGTRTVVKGSYSGDPSLPEDKRDGFPLADHTGPVKLELLLDLENNRSRKYLFREDLFVDRAEFIPMHRTELFDGKQYKVFEPRDKNTSEFYTPIPQQPDLRLQGKSYGEGYFGPWDKPMLFAVGIVPTPNTTITPERHRNPFDAAQFNIFGKGIIGTTECTILRSTPRGKFFDEWWVDRGRDYAILRWRTASSDATLLSADIQFENKKGMWIPVEWVYRTFGHMQDYKAVLATEHLHVDEVIVNPKVKDSDFDVQLSPKMLVDDIDHQKTYVVDSDGKTLLAPGTPLSRKIPNWIWWITAIVALLLTVFFARRIGSRRGKVV